VTSRQWARTVTSAKIDHWESKYFTVRHSRMAKKDAKRALSRGRRRWDRAEVQGDGLEARTGGY
jgi:hypothetical protein